MDKNIIRNKSYEQVCIWPGTIVGKIKIEDFVNFMMEQFKVRVQYLEEIKTFPNNGQPDTGGRNDLFFAVHNEDLTHFSIPRLAQGIRWIEDVLDKNNYKHKIYPARVFKYKTW